MCCNPAGMYSKPWPHATQYGSGCQSFLPHALTAVSNLAAHLDGTNRGPGRTTVAVTQSNRRGTYRSPGGTPTRYGNMSAQMKQFVDTTGGLWLKGDRGQGYSAAQAPGATASLPLGRTREKSSARRRLSRTPDESARRRPLPRHRYRQLRGRYGAGAVRGRGPFSRQGWSHAVLRTQGQGTRTTLSQIVADQVGCLPCRRMQSGGGCARNCGSTIPTIRA